MGMRFRKSKKIAPGVRVNLNAKSASISIGPKGFKKTFSTSGRTTTTVGIPGTGRATVACAAAGAKVCHVDAAKGMVAWAKENARLSHLSDAPVRWIVDDCAKFVEREIRRGRRYDALIMDPPSYGRGPSGEVWKLEENLYPFLELVVKVLSDQPLFVIINSYTTGLAPSVLGYLLDTLVTKKYGGHTECQELGLPVTASGLALPCGATGRWMADRGGRGRR